MFKLIIKSLKKNMYNGVMSIMLLGLSIFGLLVCVYSKNYIMVGIWSICIILNCFNVYNSKLFKN